MNTNRDEQLKLISSLRADIDEIDGEIIKLLVERNELALQLAENKRALGLPLENAEREKEVIKRCRDDASGFSGAISSVYAEVIKQSKRIQRRHQNLYFVGMPNCGKTRLALQVGRAMKKTYVDTDTLIMKRTGKTIDAIFDESGEASFRAIENEVLTDCAYLGGLIVATGGGILTNPDNVPILKNSGVVVFLDRSLDKLVNAKIKNRPLIRSGEEAVKKLYYERIKQYRGASDLTVDPDEKGTVARIIALYRSKLK